VGSKDQDDDEYRKGDSVIIAEADAGNEWDDRFGQTKDQATGYYCPRSSYAA